MVVVVTLPTDYCCSAQFPRSWVARSNHQRQGVYVSDFNVSCPDRPKSLPGSFGHKPCLLWSIKLHPSSD